VVEVTEVTVGAVLSITITLVVPEAPLNEDPALSVGKVNVATFKAASLIVPPFNASDVVNA
jgi:hypothetical protein